MTQLLTILAAADADELEGIAALGLDPLAILAQGATFIVLFFLIKKFAMGKIVDTLEGRRLTIEGSLDKAEALEKQNREAEHRVSKLLSEARQEAEEIVDTSRKEAATTLKEAETSATEKTEKIIADGQARIEQQVEKARKELQKETLELVAHATSIVLEEKVDAKKNEELIKKALSKASS